jgi:hypothetical protein
MLPQISIHFRGAPDRSLTGRTSVLILGRDVAKVRLIEQSHRFVIRGLRLRHQRFDARLLALQYFFSLKVTTVGVRG